MIAKWIKYISEQGNLIDYLLVEDNDFHNLSAKIEDIKSREMYMIPPADINKLTMRINKLAERIPDIRIGIEILNKTNVGIFFWGDELEKAYFVIQLIESNILVRNLIKEIGFETAMKTQFYYVVQIFKKHLDIKKRVALEKYANIFITIMFGELKERQYKITSQIHDEDYKNFILKYYK
ncbi:MAG: hypothetical protein M0R38_12090 [Bacteroidia bacterium]|nr:hypothetical protein [Bacteroidia bacterium]